MVGGDKTLAQWGNKWRESVKLRALYRTFFTVKKPSSFAIIMMIWNGIYIALLELKQIYYIKE